ncbi:RNA-directed DNA polymerase, partial [Brachionus plicatilis]
VNGQEFSFLIDTGSPVNIIDELTYATLTPRPILQTCKTAFYPYKSGTPLQVLGQFNAKVVNSKNTAIEADFVVINGRAELLLSHKTAVTLGVIKILSPVETIRPQYPSTKVEEQLKQELKNIFPKLFSDKMGCINSQTVKLQIDANTQ